MTESVMRARSLVRTRFFAVYDQAETYKKDKRDRHARAMHNKAVKNDSRMIKLEEKHNSLVEERSLVARIQRLQIQVTKKTAAFTHSESSD